ncbi:hypothetical protein DES53_115106 [Roseimicrobium gellanilyticum]|uniref:DUF4232 domain-containing protein n=1 Tax=Roseimicrobium gellanilyticum TaxID=748857 RepID=A0A366H4M6_9BACT|nr:hypothetical protein [Roseimicrobium gellanilyticum]RBP36965.1 hypothetical protein DES53_115106 [Roseimicrobium gellanilyticum]
MNSPSSSASHRANQPPLRFSGYLLSAIARQTPLISRRTKLILLALVVIPFLYVAFTWAPHEPLRFRIVEPQTATATSTATSSAAFTSVGVVIENTSATPVCLFKADLTPAASTGAGAVKPVPPDSAGRVGLFHPMEHPERQMEDGRSMIVIPGHSSVQISARVEHEKLAEATAGGLQCQYRWMSDTRRKAAAGLRWLHASVPQSLQSKVPVLADNWNICPLQTAPRS